MKFRKKPVTVDAFQWFKSMGEVYPVVCNPIGNPMTPNSFYIKTLEGFMEVSEGDWIIKGIKGEFYLCKPDIFEMTYEKDNSEAREA